MAWPIYQRVDLLERRINVFTAFKNCVIGEFMRSDPLLPAASNTQAALFCSNVLEPLTIFFEAVDLVLRICEGQFGDENKFVQEKAVLPDYLENACDALSEFGVLIQMKEYMDNIISRLKTINTRVQYLKYGNPTIVALEPMSFVLNDFEKLYTREKKEEPIMMVEKIHNYKIELAMKKNENIFQDADKNLYLASYARYDSEFVNALSNESLVQNAREAQKVLKAWMHGINNFRERFTGFFVLPASGDVIRNYNNFFNGTTVGATHIIYFSEHDPSQKPNKEPSLIRIWFCMFIDEKKHNESWNCDRKEICSHQYCKIQTGRIEKNFRKESQVEDEWTFFAKVEEIAK